MEWLSDLAGAGLSAISGGLFGLLGNVLSGVLRYFEKRQDYKHEIARWEQDTKMMALRNSQEIELQKLQAQSAREEGERELALTDARGAFDMRLAAYKDNELTGREPSWVLAVRAMTRPALTILYFGLTAYFFVKLSVGGDAMPYADAPELLRYIVFTVIFTASTCTLFWFGERGSVPPGLKR